MPLTAVQMVLGASFALIWVFIGVMIFRDRKLALRDEEESARHASHSRHAMPPRPHANFNQKPAARPHQPSAA